MTFSTFGSPVPYLPQSAAIFVTRELGAGVGGMLIAGRIVLLAVYVAIVAFAIRRSPRGRWALCAVALIPVAVFQSASSLSPDAFTNAVALLVVSSALRALDPPTRVTTAKQLVIEAALLSALLGMCKPAYVVVAGCYLLPLHRTPRASGEALGARPCRRGRRGRHVRLERDRRRSVADRRHVLRDPARSAGAQARSVHRAVALRRPTPSRTVPDQFGDWMRGLWGVGPSVTDSRDIVIGVAVVLFVLVSIQHDRDEPPPVQLVAAWPAVRRVRGGHDARVRRDLDLLDHPGR